MRVIVQFWGDRPNPRGFPDGYPAERMDIKHDEPVPDGWIEVSEEDYAKWVSQFQAQVSDINKAFDAAEKQKEEADSVKVELLEDKLRVHAEAVDSGTVLTDVERQETVDSLVKLLTSLLPKLRELGLLK